MRTICWVLLAALCAGGAYTQAWAQEEPAVEEEAPRSPTDPPPVLGGEGATLNDIAGTQTLITVVLAETGALDENLRIVSVYPDAFSFLTKDGIPGAYKFLSVREIRVQRGIRAEKALNIEESGVLRENELAIVRRAYARTEEIFQAANQNQALKMDAATLLAINRNHDARQYLVQLVESNDLMTQLEALMCVFLTGDTQPNKPLLARGLESGNRKVKALAAHLSGLMNDHSNEGYLATMITDRSAELAAPAARSLARLRNRDCIPTLLRMVTELNEEKGEAAVFALSRLGGPDVAAQLKHKYDTAIGTNRFRIARVLYNIDDPMGEELLRKEFMDIPTLAPQTAVILARSGELSAMQFLRSRLNRRYDQIEEILMFRADAAAALIEGGDYSPIAVLQELLRSQMMSVKLHVCGLVAGMGSRQLLSITQPPIESPKPEIALAAATAAVAIQNPQGFRDRVIEAHNWSEKAP